jgi:hypothetical protein
VWLLVQGQSYHYSLLRQIHSPCHVGVVYAFYRLRRRLALIAEAARLVAAVVSVVSAQVVALVFVLEAQQGWQRGVAPHLLLQLQLLLRQSFVRLLGR